MLPTDQPSKPKEDRIHEERIRQARWTFNLSIIVVGTSAAITLSGFVFLLAGRISPGAYAAVGAGGFITAAGGRCVQISKEANDRLDSMTQKLSDQ